MQLAALIPARLDSKRFPRKMLAKLGNKSLVAFTLNTVLEMGIFDTVNVVTDCDIIAKEIENEGIKPFKSQKEHHCGSDRIAEIVPKIVADIVFNIQGDEPFIDKQSIESLIQVFEQDKQQHIALASIMNPVTHMAAVNNSNEVKVVVDNQQNALYFSRSAIPHIQTHGKPVAFFFHRGIYAFRKEALIAFGSHERTPLEKAEDIECLRFLEMGRKIKMIVSSNEGIYIDNTSDLEQARKYLNTIEVTKNR